MAPGHVLLRVAACGVCGTDRHIYHGEFDARPPVIIGHEFAGTVLAVGSGVEDLAQGDRVAVHPNIACGTCRQCHRGKPHLCERLIALGVNLDGGLAELVAVPQAQCYPLPGSVSLLEGAMVGPLACCVHGIDVAGVVAGDVVAVLGGGLIGQLLLQLARLAGAGKLVLSDPLAPRREIALRSGADAVVDPRSDTPLSKGGALEGGADVVIEAVGSPGSAEQAIAWAAPGATVLWFGVTPPGELATVEPNLVFRKELTIQGARINPHTHARAIDLLAGRRIEVSSLVALDSAGATADRAWCRATCQ